MNAADFRVLVDKTQAKLPEGLAERYNYLGLPHRGIYTIDAISKALRQKILSSFSTSAREIVRVSRSFQSQFIYDSELDGLPIDPYLNIAEQIWGAMTGPDVVTEGNEDNWESAIQYAMDCMEVSEYRVDKSRFREELNLASAVKALKRKGYGFQRRDGKLFFDEISEKQIIDRLESLILRMGGISMLRRLFKILQPTYSSTLERYFLNLSKGDIYSPSKPHTPYGYLIHLAVKYPWGKKPLRNTDDAWREIVQLSTDYASIYEVQRFNQFAYLNLSGEDLLKAFRELAIFDVLFRLPQAKTETVLSMMEGLTSSLNLDERHGLGWTIRHVLTLTHYMLNAENTQNGPMLFQLNQIKQGCPGIPEVVLTYLLNTALSHPTEGANQSFFKPTDAPYLDPENNLIGHTFYSKPLLHNAGSYWMVDRAICSLGFLEALFALLRLEDRKFDAAMGLSIETYLINEFAQHGIHCASGKYRVDGKDGECDIVIETEQTIYFLELKKKPLTRNARSGSDIHLLVDLADSLLASQTQAGWHEVRIKKAGYLDLRRGDETERIDLKGRSVEKLAITLLDYGVYQDRILIKNFLEIGLSATFNIPTDVQDEILSKSIDKLNLAFEGWRALNSELFGPGSITNPFINCWFLSIPQLLLILDGVDTPTSFSQAMVVNRHLVMNTQDFYYEYFRAKSIKPP